MLEQEVIHCMDDGWTVVIPSDQVTHSTLFDEPIDSDDSLVSFI